MDLKKLNFNRFLFTLEPASTSAENCLFVRTQNDLFGKWSGGECNNINEQHYYICQRNAGDFRYVTRLSMLNIMS